MPSDRCIQSKPRIVTVIGPSAAGKSQLAKATVAILGEDVASRVPMDYFFLPRKEGESLSDFWARPLEWDWELLRRHLRLPMGTVLATPDADFETFRRRGDTGELPFRIAPVMIVDAMAPYPDADFVVRLEVPGEVRRQRLVERDKVWGTHVHERWEHLEMTWHSVGEVDADLMLDGTREIAANAHVLAGWIVDEVNRRGRR